MPKQYFAYIPFKKTDSNTHHLAAGVERWQKNVDTLRHMNGLAQKTIENLQRINANPDTERSERSDNQLKIDKLQAQIEAGPILQKKPVLLEHGDVKPLLALDAYKPEDYALYIVGHCAPGSFELRNTQSARTVTDPLRADVLMDRMVKDGLPKTILHLRLLACYGGSENPNDKNQKAFGDGLWKLLRGHCTSLVTMTAYTEPVLLTSFYAESGQGKTYGKMQLGQTLPDKLEVGGALSSVSRKYRARPCFACGQPVLKQCTVCKREFCGQQTCIDSHLDTGKICRAL